MTPAKSIQYNDASLGNPVEYECHVGYNPNPILEGNPTYGFPRQGGTPSEIGKIL